MKRPLVMAAGLALATAHALAAEPAAKADPAAGQKIATTVCAACHGADGNSPSPANPILAGQIPEYLHKQLGDYDAAKGKEPERKNPIMQGMVANLSADDKRNLAAYFSGQIPKPNSAKNKDTIDLGQRIYRAGIAERDVPACASCHGASGGGMPAQYPRLAGQYADYTAGQMKAWRSGERANDANRMMRMIAGRMTDPEIAAVSDYIAGLR